MPTELEATSQTRSREFSVRGPQVREPFKGSQTGAPVELANHGPRIRASVVIEGLHRLDELGFETVEVGRPLLLLATDLAERHGLSAYDATYLALAETLDSALLSGDARLLAAAGPRAVRAGVGGHEVSDARAAYEGSSTWAAYSEIGQYLAGLRAQALESNAAPR
jgi:hypothetical protein